MLRPSYPIGTERLLLRPFAPADHDALLAIHSRPDVTRYLYWDVRGPEDVSRVLALKVSCTALAQEGDTLDLAAFLREDGRLVGHLLENEWVKGEWTDEAIYGMLDREWEARAGS